MASRVLFFDLLRCVAAVFVIVIHVVAPFRYEIGNILLSDWIIAVSLDSFSRWAVPVFIMITGALLLSDPQPFDAKYYLKRRFAKVFIPFILWSVFYAFLAGWSLEGFNFAQVNSLLKESFHHETYYHLGFFYYFLPLYFVAPFLQFLIQKVDATSLYLIVILWLCTTGLYLFHFDGPWSHYLYLYSGYLLLGYVCYQKLRLDCYIVGLMTLVGLFSIVVTHIVILSASIDKGEYMYGRWLSYTTLNTVLSAAMVFMLGRYFAGKIKGKAKRCIEFISRYSLGIYLLHPLFLWPMESYAWYQGSPIWVVPVWVLFSGVSALGLSWLMARFRFTAWLVP